MSALKYFGFLILGLMVAWVGTWLLTVWPVVMVLCSSVAALLAMSETTRTKIFGYANVVGALLLWAGMFFLVQVVVGAAFGVALHDLYTKTGERNVFALMVDPVWMGKSFLAQAASLILSGLVAYLYVRSKHRTWPLYPAVVLCLGYLAYSTALSTSPSFRMFVASTRAKADAFLHKEASKNDVQASKIHLDAEVPLEVVIPIKGIPLWQDETRLVKVEETEEDASYFVYLSNHVLGDDGLDYVFARNTKHTATAGRFLYTEIQLHVNVAQLRKSAPASKKPAEPMPPSKPVAAVPPVVPVVAAPPAKSSVTVDQVVVADLEVSSQIIPYYLDTVIVRTDSGKKEDVARLSISWGGREWTAVTPQLYQGQWVGVLDFLQSTNPLDRPLMLKTTSGTPLNVNLEKTRRKS